MRKNEMIALLRQIELNIKFYLDNDMPNHAHNEIGVMRGLLYAIEGVDNPKLTDMELSYIKLQNDLNDIDKEVKK